VSVLEAPARWVLPEIDPECSRRLAVELGLEPLAARVLAARGYCDPAAARRFLWPSLSDLPDPFLLAGLREAVDRLVTAIRRRERILLYGDYDVDGTTSIVILKKAIELAGGHADYHVPHRMKEGYGMRAEIIERAAQEGYSLIVSVDTGIRAAEVVRHASELQIDVIITDHHLPETALPPALAVLNPNRADCPYPEKNLCGVGVVFKLLQALFVALEWPAGRTEKLLGSLMKLVAIGTVADVVPLTGENRVLVKHGLAGLSDVRNPGLRALLQVAGFPEGSSPSSGQVAFRIAPRINAAGRMADAAGVIELFFATDFNQARQLAEQLHELNRDRQQAESEIVQIILEECVRVPVTSQDAALVFAGDGWHKGVVGIVASRLVERFHRPAFVLSRDPETGLTQGSGRSIPAFHLLESLESMRELFTRFGGHRQAAGVTFQSGRLQEFRERLNAYAAARLTPADFQPQLHLDASLNLRELSEKAIGEVLAMAPFGCGNAAPLFAACGVEVYGEPVVMKEKHLRLMLRQDGRTVAVKAWNFAERADEFQAGSRVDVALCLEEDAYSAARGYPGWCATLKDVRPAKAARANQALTSVP
jgi:single-stranded-DNA-specific exonuclease